MVRNFNVNINLAIVTSTFVSCFRNTSLPENICIRKVKEQIIWFSGEEFV